jgi:hypothetical protein
MVIEAAGATYGDAIIFALTFAENHPYRFLLKVPLSLGFAVFFSVFTLKIAVLGPLMGYKADFDRKRAQTKQAPKLKGPK